MWFVLRAAPLGVLGYRAGFAGFNQHRSITPFPDEGKARVLVLV